ncbi:uncharacterized protein LOC119600347 [Lucilia sericata]|uniref:uncharacterized protein LOC119600347 n=1 Tax=Lucilia sericata TaxID=13632 RepID=UPI0018A871B7|nr:uncharacterized protein LOC119600347 [Lucilia sericata]XP_037806443.1 uncharacterized protein LOC119600347 [Lucilia sericata]
MDDSQQPTCSSSKEPSWLDKEYVKKIIQHYCNNDNVIIKNFTKNPATTKGENYFSALYLLTVDYCLETNEEVSKNDCFILKTRIENDLMSQLEEDFDVFARETQYYTVISEETQKLLDDIKDTTVFGPKAIYVDDRIIVMENLKLKGFCLNEVKQGFNLNQCHLVLQKLAKFHAVSMVLYKKNPDMFRYHLPGNISEHPSPIHEMYSKAIKSTIEYCNSQEELKKYVEKLENFSTTIIAKMINVYSRNLSDRFHVLNHGDMWVNNLMFNNEEEVLFIDFQEGFYGSPGIDWNYLLFTSWQADVFQNHLDDLIMVYHESLSDILHKLNYQQRIPTVDDVKKEIINKGFHGLATATCLLPILINEHPELADPENFVLETEEAMKNRRIIFHNPKFAERLKVFLKYFEDIKIL